MPLFTIFSDEENGTNSYCVGGRHLSSTKSMEGFMTETGRKNID